jgi:hypothetical protein
MLKPSCPTPPRELVAALDKKKLVPFIGAGVSRAGGLPDHQELLERLRRMARDENLPPHEQPDWIILERHLELGELDHAVDAIKRRVPEAIYLTWLRRELLTYSPAPTQHHVMLGLLPFPFFITTNYDRMLEQTISPSPEVLTHRELHLARMFIREQNPFVLKIHGDITRADDLMHGVLSQNVYYRRTDPTKLQEEIAALLSHIFDQYTMLFLGCSFKEHNEYTQIMERVASLSRGFSRRHFALIPRGEKDPAAIESAAKRFNLHFIEYDAANRHSAVWQFLGQLRPGSTFPYSPGSIKGTFFTSQMRSEYLEQQCVLESHGAAFRYLTPTLTNALSTARFIDDDSANTLSTFERDLEPGTDLQAWKTRVLAAMHARRRLVEKKISEGYEVRILCEETATRLQALSADSATRERFLWVIELLRNKDIDVEVRLTPSPFSEREVRSFALLLLPNEGGTDVVVAYAPQANENAFAVNIVQQNSEYAHSRLVLFEQEWARAHSERRSLQILDELYAQQDK